MARRSPPVEKQIAAGQEVPARRTGAGRFLAYSRAYAKTYADVQALRRSYDKAIACRIPSSSEQEMRRTGAARRSIEAAAQTTRAALRRPSLSVSSEC